MSCWNWQALTAHRFDPDGREPEDWDEALAHLEGCADCRRQAFALDASLAFRRPRAVPAPDVETLLAGVETLRRHSPPKRRLPWRQVTAASALLTIGLWVAPSAKVPIAEMQEPIPFVENLPVVEAVDHHPEVRIYQLADDEVSVVMIVDETLDV